MLNALYVHVQFSILVKITTWTTDLVKIYLADWGSFFRDKDSALQQIKAQLTLYNARLAPLRVRVTASTDIRLCMEM